MNQRPEETEFNSRRALLKAAGGCGLMTNTSLMATLLNLQATKAMMAAESNPQGYKAIVCLFLTGGNDSYNMLAPYDGDASSGEYGDYFTVRGGFDDGTPATDGGLALDRSTLTPISGPDSRMFGLHPGMSAEQFADGVTPPTDPGQRGVAKLYNDGNLSFVCNVGSLIHPITRTQYNNRV
ncbi:MAG: hypothetical protein AAGJ83_13740, partial [Planctomycetota bacterium]